MSEVGGGGVIIRNKAARGNEVKLGEGSVEDKRREEVLDGGGQTRPRILR